MELQKSRRINVLGVELEWKLRSGDTLNQYCVLGATVPPGVGIPPHQHPQQEAFFVLEGQPSLRWRMRQVSRGIRRSRAIWSISRPTRYTDSATRAAAR